MLLKITVLASLLALGNCGVFEIAAPAPAFAAVGYPSYPFLQPLPPGQVTGAYLTQQLSQPTTKRPLLPHTTTESKGLPQLPQQGQQQIPQQVPQQLPQTSQQVTQQVPQQLPQLPQQHQPAQSNPQTPQQPQLQQPALPRPPLQTYYPAVQPVYRPIYQPPVYSPVPIAQPVSLPTYTPIPQPIPVQPVSTPVAVAPVTPIGQHVVPVYANSHPHYQFNYGVSDPVTGDNKSQQEERDGDVVKGQYTLLQPDGITRVVYYTADNTGFHAQVTYSGPGAHPVKPVAVAPIATPVAVVKPVVQAVPALPVGYPTKIISPLYH